MERPGGRLETGDPRKRRTKGGVGRKLEPALDQRRLQHSGLAAVSGELRRGEEISAGGGGAWRTGVFGEAGMAAAGLQSGIAFAAGILRAVPQSARHLLTGRAIRGGERE